MLHHVILYNISLSYYYTPTSGCDVENKIYFFRN